MRKAAGVGVAIAVAGLLSPSAGATPAEGDIERTDLAQGTTDAPVVVVAIGHPTTQYVQELVLRGVASSGWHSHPGPEYTVITEGTVFMQSALNCTVVPYRQGQAVLIPGGVPHVVRTESDAHAVVTYTLPAGQPVRNDAPAACP
ncbi:cupin domain-containing protein [Mycolicibacterium goodii]|uniref:cupin domain-containing protein n=1 Tax=Mycolicibacterium goodii TaxID=134601 RepID=UPI001BDCE150|nr:cupin domain-containing protein [Mycolicibacterium goodii]MBU8813994.1 cupin domain-containing protein [Mycolicibacterium goodii]ULN49513.1 cupin domain-containing protein [Mycolicibacterium goodii]